MRPAFFIFLTSLFSSFYADETASLLFNGNCITCHKETKSVSAPSMVELRKVYMSAFDNKKDFVDYMSKWVADPKRETSLMDKWVKKYELMPHLGFDEDTLREISAYIYDTDFASRGGRYWSK